MRLSRPAGRVQDCLAHCLLNSKSERCRAPVEGSLCARGVNHLLLGQATYLIRAQPKEGGDASCDRNHRGRDHDGREPETKDLADGVHELDDRNCLRASNWMKAARRRLLVAMDQRDEIIHVQRLHLLIPRTGY